MIFETKRHPTTELFLKKAVRELANADAVMAGLIRRVGPCHLGLKRRNHYFSHLVQAILYQQLTAKAAESILARWLSNYPSRRFPTAEEIARTPEEVLRAAGISSQKISYLRDLSRRTLDGSLPLRRISSVEDEEVIQHLSQVKGIGRWTAEMFLIFTLGRPDVLPTTDLGIQKAAQRLYGMQSLPSPKTLGEFSQRWQPHRSVAAWYLWASMDGGIAKAPAVKRAPDR
ncbi:MAG: DNA-3-methyladenine glycosylase 2 family protein [Acidobacteria bacterium]|nr:DNA-3-methyladenine glycosylase 2 family protein [Acidobacteriota bacterium]